MEKGISFVEIVPIPKRKTSWKRKDRLVHRDEVPMDEK